MRLNRLRIVIFILIVLSSALVWASVLVRASAQARVQGDPTSQDAYEERLNTLRDVLTDPRFEYDPQPEPDLPDIAPPSVEIGQLILIVAVVVVAIAAVLYIMRTLQVQPRALDTPDEDEDPKTSEDAQAMANARETERDYRNAIRYLFLALLLSLDERGLIQYEPTLTNREHLRQIRENTRLADLLRPVVTTFDDVWYGFIPIDETGYRDFARQVDQLKTLAL